LLCFNGVGGWGAGSVRAPQKVTICRKSRQNTRTFGRNPWKSGQNPEKSGQTWGPTLFDFKLRKNKL